MITFPIKQEYDTLEVICLDRTAMQNKAASRWLQSRDKNIQRFGHVTYSLIVQNGRSRQRCRSKRYTAFRFIKHLFINQTV